VIPKKVQDAVISRVNHGKMDIAERRLPQDGRATIKLGEARSTCASRRCHVAGERIVMRLLDMTRAS